MSDGQSGEQSVRPLIHHWSEARQITSQVLERFQASQRPTFYYVTRFHNAVSQAAEGRDGVSVTR